MIFIDLIKKITFIHKPFLEINFNKYNRSKTYIFLDPPYLDDDNNFYKDKEVEPLLDKIYNVMRNFPSVFIHVKNETIDKMFKVFLVDSYAKLYPFNQKRVNHNVFMNIGALPRRCRPFSLTESGPLKSRTKHNNGVRVLFSPSAHERQCNQNVDLVD